MSHRSFISILPAVSIVAAIAGCSGAQSSSPDATLPITLGAGTTLAVTSVLQLGTTLPAGAQTTLDQLTAITDGAGGTVGYLLDRMIAAMPSGTTRVVASDLEPLVAAYLADKIAEVAPRFAPGMRAIADGTYVIAHQLTTLETLQIADGATGFRRITGVRFAVAGRTVELPLAAHGLADIVVGVELAVDASHHVAIGSHAVALPYGTLVRLGLDNAVIPGVDPGAQDLATAMRDLVDCAHLGELVADKLALGSPGLYETACATGMTAAATELYATLATLDAAPLLLDVAGSAVGGDRDGNGTLDELTAGVWTGNVSYAGVSGALVAATFSAR